MKVNKINLIAIIYVFAIVILTLVHADNSDDLQTCFLSMKNYCQNWATDPTAYECARAALISWNHSNIPELIQDYQSALFNKLVLDNVTTPKIFCHNRAHPNRHLCSAQLQSYIINNEGITTVLRKLKSGKYQEYEHPRKTSLKKQQKYAVNYAFFHAVFKYEKEPAFKYQKKNKQSFEDMYILEIYNQIDVMGDMDSPEVFCRMKFQEDYENPDL